ncbi:hypothetical protein TrST_g5415 [Triparma strigata]|uniref:SLC26A/SulP transporter domain-containing protein n=1 Tax=Triparma strigata TaxID=1606541 RepID=A0A9W7E7Q9_9STRA|nr:hypothetical protein TrST_g5415 [Triparma strigata]
MAPHWLNPFSNYSQIDDDEGHADDGDNDGDPNSDNNPNNISISPNQVSFTTHPPTPARNKHPKNRLKVTGGGDNETQSEGGGATNKSGMSEEELLKKPRSERIALGLMYGLINAAVVLPVMMSFGTIIYHDAAYGPYLPTLIKLTVISSMVHQLCFSTFSSLPYSIGQVQDAGLIFLSAMASSLATTVKQHGYDDEHLLATATVGLSLCTAFLGLGLMTIGKCKLASVVQYLPTPVVGGYLAYIGFFCGQSGLALMGGVEINGLSEWSLLFTEKRMILILPGLLAGMLTYFMVLKLRHMAVLPTCMATIILTFYFCLWATGMSCDDAREYGWIGKAEVAGPWYETWKYIQFDKVVWRALPAQVVTVVSMTVVVALSSCLDVAAIELELGKKLDYDHELKTVGLSNFVSGLTGGYSGSYIFSQTIFTLRSGVRDRYAGFTVALVEGIIVVLPFPIIAFIPRLFFGSLLIMICTDLMNEWLFEVRHKVTKAQYSVALLTFALIMFTGVEWGIFGGIALFQLVTRLGGCDEGDDSTHGASGSGKLEEGTAEEAQRILV